MANSKYLQILAYGVDEWNNWRRKIRDSGPFGKIKIDFSETDFSRFRLRNVDFRGVNLFKSNLSCRDLSRANFDGANLEKANLEHVILNGARVNFTNLYKANIKNSTVFGTHFSWCRLDEAKLINANLGASSFSYSSLKRTYLQYATINGTGFYNVDLRRVIGIEQIKHHGPSEISISTLVKSNGKIPESFLRMVGVPNSVIENIPSLIAAIKPFEYYTCFISHSDKDHPFAERLYADLQTDGIRCWFDMHDMKGGEKTLEQIDQAIRNYDKVLLILSDHSMQSKWVKTEIDEAIRKEQQSNYRVLFPISIVDFKKIKEWRYFDSDTGRDFAKEVREYFVPDFSDWKNHDIYKKQFNKLLSDLKIDNKIKSN